MKTSTILSTFAASLAAASPLVQRNATPSVEILAYTAGINNPNGSTQTITVKLNQLQYSSLEVTKLQVSNDNGAGGINSNFVECRMYKDAAGTQVGSLPFNTTDPALISTNTVSIGSLLCYVIKNS
ncbi:hypothetical protein NA57DRAFT_76547 [Rhizodiscina lignyota]|uniref:Uncharacterized protein n=1 Tax=Rhizodiscina lignyota TaxID=1504668 RepID=A0A9P4M576_9PEZI|nr:hypothetical protein NA57DRAFT_76547 [Rhizodiscina lignyota]